MDTSKVELMIVMFLMVLSVEVGFASRSLLTSTEHAYGGEHGLGGEGLGGGIGGLGGGYGFGGLGGYEGGYGRFRHHHKGCGCRKGYGYGHGGGIGSGEGYGYGGIGSGEGYGYGGGKGGGIGYGAGVKDGIDHVDAGIATTTKEHVINTDVATGASKHADGTKHAP